MFAVDMAGCTALGRVASPERDKFGACRATVDDDRRSRRHSVQRDKNCGRIWGPHGERMWTHGWTEILRNVKAARSENGFAHWLGWEEVDRRDD